MKIYDTRIKMLDLVKGGKVCEIGALKGDFAEVILAIVQPKELVLVDIWPEEVYSGDVNGNNLEKFNGEQLFNHVTKRFELDNRVTILREFSTEALKKYPDNYFDMIYVDADHTYKAVVKDLKWAYKKIKKDGFIMGHDYEINPDKTLENYDFGVRKAVDEFCKKHKLDIYAKAKDGCVSYAIKVKK